MNKLIVVTGGTKGIGRSIVQKFIENGFDVAICSRNQAELVDVKQQLNQDFPTNIVHIYKADLSEKNDCNAFISFLKNLGKPVDVLINNTGFYIPGQVISEDDGVLESMISTNLYSAYNLTRGLVGEMINRKKGHIFNICSIASIIPYPNGGSYSISKYAMYGMTQVLREELKPHGIKVTAVLPGATRTASWDGFADSLPEDRLMDPADVAEMIYSTYSLSARSVVEEIIIRPQLGDL
jgi:short-subunit dehydrogenase